MAHRVTQSSSQGDQGRHKAAHEACCLLRRQELSSDQHPPAHCQGRGADSLKEELTPSDCMLMMWRSMETSREAALDSSAAADSRLPASDCSTALLVRR